MVQDEYWVKMRTEISCAALTDLAVFVSAPVDVSTEDIP